MLLNSFCYCRSERPETHSRRRNEGGNKGDVERRAAGNRERHERENRPNGQPAMPRAEAIHENLDMERRETVLKRPSSKESLSSSRSDR